MYAKHVLVGLAIVGFCVVFSSAEDSPSQPRYRERLNKERQLVKKFESEALIGELGSRDFYRREAAEEELIARSIKAAPAAMEGLIHADPEIVSRSERVLNGIRSDVWKSMEVLEKTPLQIRSQSSFYWSGINPHLGGVPDTSLDSALKIVAPFPVTSVKSPATVKAALTTRFESIRQQVWCFSSSECYQRREFTTNLYLQRPRQKAVGIWVLVEIEAKVIVAEEIHVPLRIGGKVEPRKGITWANVVHIGKAEKGVCRVEFEVCDFAGRLKYASIDGVDERGKMVDPTLTTLPFVYRNKVILEVGEKVRSLVIKPVTGPVREQKIQGWVIITPPQAE